MNGDLISRSALLAAFNVDRDRHGDCPWHISAIETEIEAAPAVDAVEVVRCRDCKYSGMYCFGDSTEKVLACLGVEDDGFVRCATSVDTNGFCSYGERRTDETD